VCRPIIPTMIINDNQLINRHNTDWLTTSFFHITHIVSLVYGKVKIPLIIVLVPS
jgi:hypothetical protein